jgi:hypothetical protein
VLGCATRGCAWPVVSAHGLGNHSGVPRGGPDVVRWIPESRCVEENILTYNRVLCVPTGAEEGKW